ncbi:unnamed protein product [Adineta steineri]|uniref:Uncharacterized protein n=1 Tax=Adineta steineri TaxID=433720 RepID=A0A814DZR1_9BILA|nr:unnamed protein product [Adineta steineri]CAF1256399.1 unnamed protein product [Adineta steineri]
MRIGTITQTEKDNYDMFCKVITNGQIPVICVITGCENEDPMSEWVITNESTFSRNEMTFNAMVGTCFAKGGRFEQNYRPLREESATMVWEAIMAHSARVPVDFLRQSGGFSAVVRRVWNHFCNWIGQNAWRWINQHVRDMLVRLGFTSDEAGEVAQQFD